MVVAGPVVGDDDLPQSPELEQAAPCEAGPCARSLASRAGLTLPYCLKVHLVADYNPRDGSVLLAAPPSYHCPFRAGSSRGIPQLNTRMDSEGTAGINERDRGHGANAGGGGAVLCVEGRIEPASGGIAQQDSRNVSCSSCHHLHLLDP